MDALKGKPLNLKEEISYADGAVISKTLLKKETGNITLFSFDTGQGLSEHTSPFDAVVQVIEGEGAFIIDGVLHTVYQIPTSIMGAVTSRIKGTPTMAVGSLPATRSNNATPRDSSL